MFSVRVLFLRNVKIFKSLKDCWSAAVKSIKAETQALYLSDRISNTCVNTEGK